MNPSLKLRRSEERKQSYNRIGVGVGAFILLTVYNLIHHGTLDRSLILCLAAILTHSACSLIWHQYITKRPEAWPARIYLTMAMDVGVTSLAYNFAAEFGAFFYPVFLWIIVGYGLRYGRRMLFSAATVGFVTFGLVLKYNTYWQDHTMTGVGIWWGIIILPAFFLTVLNRLGSLNKQLSIELIRSKAAEKAKGQFLANMSHEIRTPLNGVLGMAQILNDAQIDNEGRHHLDILRHSAESLLDILNDILDFSKITSGKMSLDKSPFDLHRLLNDVVQILSPAAQAKALTLKLDYPATAPHSFQGDPVRIRQIFLNLVSNAIKFTEVGQIVVTAAVCETANGQGDITICVEDTGIGIPEDRLPYIFDQFEQVNATTNHSFGGTGLGLAISQLLARRMKGDIRVQSIEGHGSTFVVDLSLPTSSLETVAATKRSTLPRFNLQVLVAEDNNVNQLVIRKLLKKIGIDPIMAVNGQEAIHILESRPFDLIIMDVRMPVLNGIEATRQIRARDDALSRIPIIALTADADADSARRCLEVGMNLHLGKPMILEQAVAAIERLGLAEPPVETRPVFTPYTDAYGSCCRPSPSQIQLQ